MQTEPSIIKLIALSSYSPTNAYAIDNLGAFLILNTTMTPKTSITRPPIS
jgi:hypothetical protein